MKTYLGHLIRNTWFTLTWEATLALALFFGGFFTEKATTYPLLDFLAVFLIFIGIVGLILIPVVELTKNYWKTLYRDQGFFTHTLPISKGKIFTAHVLWFCICSIIFTTLLTLSIISLIFILKGSPSADDLAVIKTALLEYKGTIFFYLISSIIIFPCVICIYFASISVGMHSRLYAHLGIAAPILMVILCYTIQQVLLYLGFLFIPPIWHPQKGLIFQTLMSLVYSNPNNTAGIPILGWIPLIPATVFICYLAIRFMNRNLSVN